MSKPKEPANKIAFLRRSRNLTQSRLGQMIGEMRSTMNRIESGEIPFEPYRLLIAKALKCKPEDLDNKRLKLPTTRITRYIKNKYYIYPMPEDKITEVQAIPGLPKTTEVLIIKNPDLKYVHAKNELLYFDSAPAKKDTEFLNRECIIRIERKTRGDTLLAWVTAGSSKGKYILHFHNEPIMIDVKILAAHPILHISKDSSFADAAITG
jgi:transcriptional regulator with XRE-family HTH domain